MIECTCGDCGKTFLYPHATNICPRCFTESDGPYEEDEESEPV